MSFRNKISRRGFLGISLAGALLATGREAFGQSSKKANEMILYVGTYTSNTSSAGIYVYAFEKDSGRIKLRQIVKDVADPSFLTVSNDRRHLYAVNELLEFEGQKSGAVSSFAIDQKNGNIKFINKQPSLGGAPCFITTTANRKFALVANYLGGNISVHPLGSDGRIGASVDLAQHTGFGPNKDRQEAAHAHSITLDRNNRYAFAADLGIDRLMIYAFDTEKGKLTPNSNQPYFQAKPGAGPRHFEFHPNGKHAFLINELTLSITSLAYDEKLGTLKEIETVPTLPAEAPTAGATCADIHVSPDGRFVYGSNRGHNSIVCYAFDEATGKLSFVEHAFKGIRRPRNFAITPDGRFLLVANQDGNSIVVFSRDQATGKLTPTGNVVSVPAPVCLKLIQSF